MLDSSPLLIVYSLAAEAAPCTMCLVTNAFYTAPVATAGLTARLRGSVKQMAPGLVKNLTVKVRGTVRKMNSCDKLLQNTLTSIRRRRNFIDSLKSVSEI